MNNRSCICALCGIQFIATTSYGLCPACWNKDRLREYDRLCSVQRFLTHAGVLAPLTLPEWLSILSDFRGRCAYCLEQRYQLIERVNEHKGLVRGNVVPICRGCRVHKLSSWETAVERVQYYLNGDMSLLPLTDLEEVSL